MISQRGLSQKVYFANNFTTRPSDDVLCYSQRVERSLTTPSSKKTRKSAQTNALRAFDQELAGT